MKKIELVLIFFLIAAPLLAHAAPTLLFSEIMYDLRGSDAGREWVELYNNGSAPAEIITGTATTSFRFFDGTKHVLKLFQGDTVMQPNGFAILADNAETWFSEHPGFVGTIFETTFSLKNTSSTIGLSSTTIEPLFTSVSYDSSWGAAGDGYTLERKEVSSAENNFTNWTVSLYASGTPGFWEPFSQTPTSTSTTTPTATTTPEETPPPTQTNNPPPSIPSPHQWSRDIRINEVLPNPAGPDTAGEWIELYNQGTVPLDLDGWSVQDDSSTVYTISEKDFALTTISPGGYFIILRDKSKITLNNSGGESVKLYWPDGTLVEVIFYSDTAPEDKSWSRFESGWQWSEPTQSRENHLPMVQPHGGTIDDDAEPAETSVAAVIVPPEGSLFLTEALPNPDGRDDTEWIEIHASSTAPLDLTHWLLDDGDGGSTPYRFPAGTILQPREYFIVTKSVSGLSLNNARDSVRLIDLRGTVWDQVSYEKALSGQSYAYDEQQDEWAWTTLLTPGSAYQQEQNSVDGAGRVGSEVLGSTKNSLDVGRVTVEGIVIMPAGILAKRTMYLVSAQDNDSRTIEIYNYHGDFPKLHVGDRVEVVGEFSEQTATPRVTIEDASRVAIVDTQQSPVATAFDIAELNPELSRSWVTLSGTVQRLSVKSFSIANDDERITIYPLLEAAGMKPAKGDEVSVTGFLYYRGATPYLYLLRISDFVVRKPKIQGYATTTSLEPTSDAHDPSPLARWYYIVAVPAVGVVGLLLKRFARSRL